MRPRKAKLNTVVRHINGDHYTIVDYRAAGNNRYRAIRSDALGRHAYGPAVWLDSDDFDVTSYKSKRPGIIYRANLKQGGDEVRGCVCQCCPHVKGYDEG